MNAEKTQLVWLGTRQQLAKLTTTELPLLSAHVKPSSAVLDLGVNIDSQLTMADHVAALRRSCLFQLRQLRMVRSSLTSEATKTLVQAFVSSRLDYCNSLLHMISDGLLTKLQTVQNAAARVVTGTRKFDHITPVLRQLHWLQVRQRITFKLAMIVFKCLHGLAPSYLADVTDVCTPVSSVVGRWQLRSADSSCRCPITGPPPGKVSPRRICAGKKSPRGRHLPYKSLPPEDFNMGQSLRWANYTFSPVITDPPLPL